ncbi:hypothetical protein J6590_087406 [Homalodisca vitripennis]|nr:hypothetical protein J6590_087406 [Homalodisca vitripennis]
MRSWIVLFRLNTFRSPHPSIGSSIPTCTVPDALSYLSVVLSQPVPFRTPYPIYRQFYPSLYRSGPLILSIGSSIPTCTVPDALSYISVVLSQPVPFRTPYPIYRQFYPNLYRSGLLILYIGSSIPTCTVPDPLSYISFYPNLYRSGPLILSIGSSIPTCTVPDPLSYLSAVLSQPVPFRTPYPIYRQFYPNLYRSGPLILSINRRLNLNLYRSVALITFIGSSIPTCTDPGPSSHLLVVYPLVTRPCVIVDELQN